MRQLGTNIWLNDGPDIMGYMGFHYPTRMVVVRCGGDKLFIWSPTAFDGRLLEEVQSLGQIAWLVAPNELHFSHLADWSDACPGAEVFGPVALHSKLGHVDFVGTPDAAPWAADLDQQFVANRIAGEWVFFHRESGTAIITDLVQQMPQNWYSGWRRWVAEKDLMLGKVPQVPRKFRMGFIGQGGAKPAVRQILTWPVARVVMAHGDVVEEDAPGFLQGAFRFLV